MVRSGVSGIENENDFCGVGFVIIPDGIDAENYKLDCYRNGKISIFGGYGHSNFYDIKIDGDVLQDIYFPKNGDQYGSPVVWINIPKHNSPIVIANLSYDQDISNATEFAKKFTRTYKQNVVNFEMNAKEGKVNLSVNSNDKSSKFEIFVNSKDHDSELIIKVDGKTIIHSTDRIIAISDKSVETAVTNKRGVVIAKTSLSSSGEERFIYEDEYANKLSVSKESINLSKNNNGSLTMFSNGDIQFSTDGNVDIQAGNKSISLDDGGINIDAGDDKVFINGNKEVLYSKVPGLSSIADVSQIGISKTVKVG